MSHVHIVYFICVGAGCVGISACKRRVGGSDYVFSACGEWMSGQ